MIEEALSKNFVIFLLTFYSNKYIITAITGA